MTVPGNDLTQRMKAALSAAATGTLISAYGNGFFVSGTAGHETFQRSTLEALRRRGLLSHVPGLTGRGEYSITAGGRAMLVRE